MSFGVFSLVVNTIMINAYQRAAQSYAHCLNNLAHSRNRSHSEFVTHYLDDILFAGVSSIACAALLQSFKEVCAALGFPIALEKTLLQA